MAKKGMLIALVGAGLFALCGTGAMLVTADADPPKAPAETGIGSPSAGVVVGQEGAKAVPKVLPTSKAVPVTIGDGTWEVGTDVKAGKYRTPGPVNSVLVMCYWDVRNGSEEGEIVAQGVKNDLGAQGLVTLRKGQFFTTSGCEAWSPR